MAYRDPAVGRAKDRERFRRRVERRKAAGLCPRCGDRPPAPERSICAPCADKSNRASRKRDARLRAEGKPRRDPAKARGYERKRSRREAAARKAEGLCFRCGREPAAPGRSSCEPCLVKRREADRVRYAAGKASGLKYGGADAEAKRRAGRAKSRRRQKARIEAGLCIRCGRQQPAEGGTTCTPCRAKRQQAEQRQYAERRAAGCCTRCGGPVHDGLSRCGPCAIIDDAGRNPERKNGQSRRRYRIRRELGLCTSCGAPSQGASRCVPCAERSYHNSGHFRGMPAWPPSYAVFLRDTDVCLGSFDDEMEVAAFIAFEKLDRERIEIVRDANPLAAMAAWE